MCHSSCGVGCPTSGATRLPTTSSRFSRSIGTLTLVAAPTDRNPGVYCRFAMSSSLSELLKLPAGERAELAMALWESLSEAEREGELELTPDEAAELDRRWMDHVQRPESSIPWDEVRRKLRDRE